LETWATSLKKLMVTLCRLTTRCVIVTNSARGWVDSCINRFVPGLRECLSEEGFTFHVVHAQELLPKRSIRPCRCAVSEHLVSKAEKEEIMTMGKFVAMRNEVRRFYSQYRQQTWKNIISIGDAPYERHALQEVAFKRNTIAEETLRTKTITLKTGLTLDGMIHTLRTLQSLLPKWVSHDGDLDITLSPHTYQPDHLQVCNKGGSSN